MRNLYYSSLLIILVYVTMLNTFAYHAYWEERISQGFGQVDGLEFKVVHGLLISSSDYREWGLSLFDATIQFLTSWQGLTFYAIVIVILLLQLTPLLAMRSKYFVPVTIFGFLLLGRIYSSFCRESDTASILWSISYNLHCFLCGITYAWF